MKNIDPADLLIYGACAVAFIVGLLDLLVWRSF